MPSSSGRIRQARAATRPHILVFAYACEPGRGSEPGAGWGLVRALATFADCTVLVGPEHVPAIRRWEADQRDAGLEFVEVPEPWWAHREPRHRLTRFAVYIAWLRRAHAVGLVLHRRRRFDAVYHATYSGTGCRALRSITTSRASGDPSAARLLRPPGCGRYLDGAAC